jgi:pyridoxamine 5'-phosphate oxidase
MAGITEFSEKGVAQDPYVQFRKWYNEHLEADVAIPDAVSLGTASSEGRVSVRTVLLKDYDDKGFIFFTNYTSKKGMQMEENPSAAMHFYWSEAGRQVRIEGIIERLSEAESSVYFMTRPRESQISAWASEQSSVIPDRRYLEKRYEYFKTKYENKAVEKPPHWGGFRLIPDFFEFWHDGAFRLHDRIVYTKGDDSWIINRLAP